MALVQGNHEIQALPAHRADQSFTISVRRWCPHGSAQNFQFKVTVKFLVQLPGEDRIVVVDQELIRMIARDRFPELLQRPVCGRMRGYVVVENAAAANFHHDENQQHLESGRNRNQKVAGDNSPGMIADERSPVLRRGSGAPSTVQVLRPVLADGARRNADPQL